MVTTAAPDLDTIVLLRGNHKTRAEGVCFMEAVAWVAGEKHSDQPKCACPILAAFMRKWNDDLDDAGRQILKPYISKLVGTKSTPEVEQRRGWMLTDWMIRVHTPAWLRLAKLEEQAAALEVLAAISSPEGLAASHLALDVARNKAAAARAAAWDAARDAARDAAWAAARDAAYDSARQVLKPTELSLQQSALQLLDRMIEAR